jgi:molecular chaperone DnaJ
MRNRVFREMAMEEKTITESWASLERLPRRRSKSYRKIAMDHHPDRNPGNKSAEENSNWPEAYEVLRSRKR